MTLSYVAATIAGMQRTPSDHSVFVRSTVALLIAFLPLAFSDDLLRFVNDRMDVREPSSWALLPLDFSLYLAIAVLLWGFRGGGSGTRRLRFASIGTNQARVLTFFAASLCLTLLIDAMTAHGWSAIRFPLGAVIASFLYVVPQVLLYMSISLAVRQQSSRVDWVVGVPLLIGTLSAWIVGVLIWTQLEAAAPTGKPRVDQEYFAQMTQVLPVLLIALAVELRFFSRQRCVTRRGKPGSYRSRCIDRGHRSAGSGSELACPAGN